jgi:hypothetical protein
MGRRRSPDRWPGASSVCCRIVAVVFLLCFCRLLVVAVAATDAARLGPGADDELATRSSPVVERSGGNAAGADAFWSSKRRIPKGPDPIHNRYVQYP